ncbi:Ubiquitin-related modifier 1 [Carabus blaptoides fortunei]
MFKLEDYHNLNLTEQAGLVSVFNRSIRNICNTSVNFAVYIMRTSESESEVSLVEKDLETKSTRKTTKGKTDVELISPKSEVVSPQSASSSVYFVVNSTMASCAVETVTNADSSALPIIIEFGGGAELLFDKKKVNNVSLPLNSRKQWTMRELLLWIRDNLLKERPELFLQDDSVRPGILVLVNDADWELMDTVNYVINPNDKIVFISTLHGG